MQFKNLSPVTIMAMFAFFGMTTAAAIPATDVDVVKAPVSSSTLMARGRNDAYPQPHQWVEFEHLFNLNHGAIRMSCPNMFPYWATSPDMVTDDQINMMHDAILQVSGETGVDSRFILTIMMQESHGCPNVHTTNNGVHNPGLMQSHNGVEFVGNWADREAQRLSILQMIRDGAAGTASGIGLRPCLDMVGQRIFSAARCYNSGPNGVSEWDLSHSNGATASYVADIAQRLTGQIID